MDERKVEVYFHVAFETHTSTVNREADISHVMSIDSLLFNLQSRTKKLEHEASSPLPPLSMLIIR